MKINIKDYQAYKYYNKLKTLLDDYKNREIVFFCVGNYKIWFDCFAPLIAELLRCTPCKCFIYGGVSYSITPQNLTEYMDFVTKKHPYACVVVVDNCITLNPNESGSLVIDARSTVPAAFSNNIGFGNISVLLKTYPKQNSYCFLQQQQQIASILAGVINKLIN